MSRNRDPFYLVKNMYKCAFYMRVLTDEKFLESIVLIFIIELGYYAKENEGMTQIVIGFVEMCFLKTSS